LRRPTPPTAQAHLFAEPGAAIFRCCSASRPAGVMLAIADCSLFCQLLTTSPEPARHPDRSAIAPVARPAPPELWDEELPSFYDAAERLATGLARPPRASQDCHSRFAQLVFPIGAPTLAVTAKAPRAPPHGNPGPVSTEAIRLDGSELGNEPRLGVSGRQGIGRSHRPR
jgi:hypothetical protein